MKWSKTMLKRILIYILAVAMLVSCFGLVSCKKKTGDTETSNNTAAEEPTGPVGSEVDATLDVPEDLKYNDVFKVLGFDGQVPEFGDADLAEPDDVEQSLLARDVYVENRLGVAFEYSQINGQWSEAHNFSDAVYESVLMNSQAWDLIGTYSLIPADLAVRGVVVDLLQQEYTNFNKAWYSPFMVDAVTVNGKAYSISGDISSNLLYSMQGVVFNPQEATKNGIAEQDLYQMVYDGDWTLENWFSMCEDMGRELGGDGVWSPSDYYPIVVADDPWIDSFYYCVGLKLVDEDDDGVLTISPDLTSEKALSIFSMVKDAINVYHCFAAYDEPKALTEERCIFAVTQLVEFRKSLASTNLELRVLPFPKYEEGKDTTYQTMLSFGHAQYCIPKDAKDLTRSSAVLETLGFASYTMVTPMIFENMMKLRYSSNPDVAAMFDYLRNGCMLDSASLYCIHFDGTGINHPHGMFRTAVVHNIDNWTSNYINNFKTGIDTIVKEMNEFYSK